MALSHQIFLFAILLILTPHVSSLALQNITLPLPPGTTNHNTPGLLCTPTQPFDLLIFYLLNYVAHAATVLTRPGERADDYLAGVIGALLFPALGLYRGIEAIFSGALFVRHDDLRKAAKSGALCIVVRGAEWRPEEGDTIKNVVLKRGPVKNQTDATHSATLQRSLTGDTLSEGNKLHIIPFSPPTIFSRFGAPIFVHRRIIHGRHSLPGGYRFAILPHDAQFEQPLSTQEDTERPNIEVSATVNAIKALIALGQSAYALMTLYRARGDQINQFGYAAFGLTVAPYAVMSIMNLIGNVCRPDYSSLYMVESSIMDEARSRGAVFEGSVARVEENADLAVCGCGLKNHGSGAEDLEEVRFSLAANSSSSSGGDESKSSISGSSSSSSTGSRTLEAHFNFTDPHAYDNKRPLYHPVHRNKDNDNDNDTSSPKHHTALARTLPLHPRTWLVAPTPKNLNYTGTKRDAALLVPCHPPLVRSTPPISPSIMEPPPERPMLSGLTLRRTYIFRKHRTWQARYMASKASVTARRWTKAKYFFLVLIELLPLAIIGAMSKFRRGAIPAKEGSTTWCVYTLEWLCFGVVTGVWWVIDQERKDAAASLRMQVGPFIRAVGYIFSASSAVGGYIVVGQMLFRYGSCVWIGN